MNIHKYVIPATIAATVHVALLTLAPEHAPIVIEVPLMEVRGVHRVEELMDARNLHLDRRDGACLLHDDIEASMAEPYDETQDERSP